MYLKKVTRSQGDGQIDNFIYLTKDDGKPRLDNGRDETRTGLGSMSGSGIDNLIGISNSINDILVGSSLRAERDCIVSARSYGFVYLIEQILDKLQIDESDLFAQSDTESRQKQFSLIPSLIAALLDEDTSSESRLSRIQRRIFFPNNILFDSASISETVNQIELNIQDLDMAEAGFSDPDELFEQLRQNSDACSASNESSSEMSISKIRCLQITRKLIGWLKQESGSWSDIVNPEDVFKFVAFTMFIYRYIESITDMEIDVLTEHLSELQVVRVDHETGSVFMTTRPTSTQMSIFFRVDIEHPRLILEDPIRAEKQSIVREVAYENEMTLAGERDKMHELAIYK